MKPFLGRWWPFSIRLQLMLWYTIVFALLLFLSDTLLYTQLQSSLITNLDTALQLQTDQIASGVSNDNGKIAIQDVTGDLPDVSTNTTDTQDSSIDVTFGTLIRVLDAKGNTVRITPAFRSLIIPTNSLTQPLHGTPWQGNVMTYAGQEVRLYSMVVTENKLPFAIVQVGASLTQLNTSLHSVMIELLLIAPFALLLGAFGSYWLAARAFTPIDRLTHTAQRITAIDLHERVPVPHTHDEIHRLARTLNEMIERLDQAFARQRRFVADASHELRTPVAVIRSITDLALLQDMTPQNCKLLLENINTETERLSHLINDLLVLARSDEGKIPLEKEPVHLEQLVVAVAANAEVLATERNITLHVQVTDDVIVLGDEARLIQAVMNLLDNAIFYTNANGHVTLNVTKKADQAYLTIRDTGIGIAAEHLPHIFERFYRADSARIRTEGNSSGLGLAIVDWVIQAHGGRITIESQPGQGSTFTVALPLRPTTLMPIAALPTQT